MPHIDQRVCERLALRRKHASADHEALRLGARFHERGAKRGIRSEKRSLGLARRNHAAGLGEAFERDEQRGTKHATTGKDHGFLLGALTGMETHSSPDHSRSYWQRYTAAEGRNRRHERDQG